MPIRLIRMASAAIQITRAVVVRGVLLCIEFAFLLNRLMRAGLSTTAPRLITSYLMVHAINHPTGQFVQKLVYNL